MTPNEIKSKLKSNGIAIKAEDIEKISNLPKHVVIPVLVEILIDSIQNISFYRHRASFVPSFPVPALFLLADLKANEAFGVVNNFMLMSRADLDFWLGDAFTEKFWLVLYHIADNQFLSLIDLALYRRTATYNLLPLSMALSQVAAHQPSRRAEIMSYYYLLFKHFLQTSSPKIDEEVRELLSGMVCDLMRIRAHELLFVIKLAFHKNYIDKETTGDLEEVIAELRRGAILKRRLQTCYEVCRDVQSWAKGEENDRIVTPQFRR